MTPEQKTALLAACDQSDEVRIITCALHIAATAARERKQDVAMAIRHLVDAHQGRDQAEKAYREIRRAMAAQIMAGLVGNPKGPYQKNTQEGWGLVNCDEIMVAEECVRLADALMVANETAPIPLPQDEANP